MKIALLGSRGIPAIYGGFETLIEELSSGLASSDTHKIIVYCRRSYFKSRPPILNRVHLIYLPAPRIKALESLLHSFLSSLHVLRQDIDVVYFVDPANAPFCALLRLLGKNVIIHTNGLGWKRRKWGPLARQYYEFVEWLSARTANALVTDNPRMQEYYSERYNADSTYIPYGAANHASPDCTVYKQFGLSPKNYFLVVARLEPENNTDFIINEYTCSKIKIPMVIVGDSPYNPKYMAKLEKLADDQIRFVGRINNQNKLNALYSGAYTYLHGHEVGGTNPSLLRAMYFGATPVVINVPFNTAVVGECGFVFDKSEGHLTEILQHLTENPTIVKAASERARKRVEEHFKWENVVKAHEDLFHLVAEK